MKIPFVDLKAQYKSIKVEIDEAIQSVINETAFIKGKYVAQFEKQYAEKYGVKLGKVTQSPLKGLIAYHSQR